MNDWMNNIHFCRHQTHLRPFRQRKTMQRYRMREHDTYEFPPSIVYSKYKLHIQKQIWALVTRQASMAVCILWPQCTNLYSIHITLCPGVCVCLVLRLNTLLLVSICTLYIHVWCVSIGVSDSAMWALLQINTKACWNTEIEIRAGDSSVQCSHDPVTNIHDPLAAPWGSGPAPLLET